LSSTERIQFLFGTSSFVLTAFSVFVTFGALIVAKRMFGGAGLMIPARNDFVTVALILGVILLETALILRLYALLSRYVGLPVLGRAVRDRSEWFLKVASAAFSTGAAVNIAVAIHRYRTFWRVGAIARSAPSSAAMREAANAILTQAFGVAAFFLLLAIFSLVYLLNLKYTQFSSLTSVVDLRRSGADAGSP
jgi:hypothetical protein